MRSQGWWLTTVTPGLGNRGRRITASLRSACSTQWVSGQPGLQSETLSCFKTEQTEFPSGIIRAACSPFGGSIFYFNHNCLDHQLSQRRRLSYRFTLPIVIGSCILLYMGGREACGWGPRSQALYQQTWKEPIVIQNAQSSFLCYCRAC